MPSIRGYVIDQLAVEAATMSVPLPVHETNDILIVILVKDVNRTGTWSVTVGTGWSSPVALSAGTAMDLVYIWKRAESNAEAWPTLGGQTDVDSMLAVAIAIKGAPTTGSPFDAGSGSLTSPTAVAGVQTVPGITTQTNNCLVFYVMGEATGVGLTPMPGTIKLVADDTATVGLGVSYTFQAAAGATGNGLFYGAGTSGSTITSVKWCFAIMDDGTSGELPAYHDRDATLATLIDPMAGGNVLFATTIPANTIYTPIGSKTVAYDAASTVVDTGANPFHPSFYTTPAASATNLGGHELVFATNQDLSTSTGLIIGSFKFYTARDYIDAGTYAEGGVQLAFIDGDASVKYASWMIGAQRAETTDPDGRNIYAIQLNQSSNTSFATTTPTLSNIDFIQLMQANPRGIGGILFSQLLVVETLVVVGGSSTVPVSFDDLIKLLGSYVLSFGVPSGTGAVLSYIPIKIGGGKSVKTDIKYFQIQFPRCAAPAAGYMDYHVDEGKVGIILDGRSGDQIKITNGTIQSYSKWKFELPATASSAATWDFDGLTIINAIPTLRDIGSSTAAGFRNVTFINCDQIAQNAAYLYNCKITGTQHATSGLLAGAPANVNRIVNTTFTSDGLGHAIEITGTAADCTLSGDIFTGYASSNGSTGNEAIFVNIATGAMTINVVNNGNTPSIKTAGATVTVSNSKSFVVTNIIDGSEIRIIKQSDLTELAGAENVGASPSGLNGVTVAADPDNAGRYKVTYPYGYTVDIPVYVVVHHVDYQFLRPSVTLKSTDGSLQVAQVSDRQYDRGTTYTPG